MTESVKSDTANKAHKALILKTSPKSQNLMPLKGHEAISLQSLVCKITPENCHRELEFGVAVGAESL